MVGTFKTYNQTPVRTLVRLQENGTIDAGFTPDTAIHGNFTEVAVLSDGKIIAAGNFFLLSYLDFNVCRLNTDGSLDTTFALGNIESAYQPHFSITTLLVQPDGKILVGGTFERYNGIIRNNLVRLKAEGAIDMNFDPGNEIAGVVYALALQADEKLMVGGHIALSSTNQAVHVTRLNTDGTRDVSFTSGFSLWGHQINIRTIAIQADQKVLIGGDFCITITNHRTAWLA